jgi:hypothetical protein
MKLSSGHSYLISSKTDWLTIGGLSILIFPLFLFFIPNDSQLSERAGGLLYAIAFIVNYPHFTVAYQLIYGDYRHLLLKDYRFIWAGIIVPVLIIFYITWALLNQSSDMLAYFVEFMFVIVGWHYTKQAYGVVMVTSSMKKYFFNKWERWSLKTNMYALWITSFLSFNIGENSGLEYWGIKYYSLNFPMQSIYIAYGVTAISLTVFTYLMIRRIVKTKLWPPFISIVSFVSIYVWFLPIFYDPIFNLAIPFFHSIQYFTFVIALKKNEITAETKNKEKLVKRIISYVLVAILTGVVFFEALPRIMDFSITYNHQIFGEGLFLFLFSVFINIHHYFIDNVIWRADNKKVQEYLFS